MYNYEYCPICGCRDIEVVARRSGYTTFRCEDCGKVFDVDDCYLEKHYPEDQINDKIILIVSNVIAAPLLDCTVSLKSLNNFK